MWSTLTREVWKRPSYYYISTEDISNGTIQHRHTVCTYNLGLFSSCRVVQQLQSISKLDQFCIKSGKPMSHCPVCFSSTKNAYRVSIGQHDSGPNGLLLTLVVVFVIT